MSMLQRFFIENVGLKIVSLLLALGTWIGVTKATNNEATVHDIPIEILQEKDTAILETSTSTCTVQFRGSKNNISLLVPERVRARVDLRGRVLQDEVRIKLTPNDLIYPGLAKVLSIEPAELQIQFDVQGEKKLPVEVALSGELPEGYQMIGEPVVTPSNAVLFGSVQKLRGVNRLLTETVDLNNLTRSIERDIAIAPPQENWQGRTEPSRVHVKARIQPITTTLVLSNQVVNLLMQPGKPVDHRAEPPAVEVTVQSASKDIEQLAEAVRVFVDCCGLPKTTNAIPLEVHLPPGLQLKSVTPENIRLIRGTR